MKHRTTGSFWKRFELLPSHIQKAARKNYKLLRDNPDHPSLRFKKLKPLSANNYSVRASQGYRAIGQPRGDEMFWVWIGPHHEYDKLLKGL